MAITKGAKKALRQSLRKKAFNDARKKTLRASMKALKASPSAASLAAAYKAIDKAQKTGLIKKNTAARRKALAAKLLK
jgi:ribosomal protein S20